MMFFLALGPNWRMKIVMYQDWACSGNLYCNLYIYRCGRHNLTRARRRLLAPSPNGTGGNSCWERVRLAFPSVMLTFVMPIYLRAADAHLNWPRISRQTTKQETANCCGDTVGNSQILT